MENTGSQLGAFVKAVAFAADKHRNHAIEIGVNEYMGKPYQEDQLLALIRRYTSESAIA